METTASVLTAPVVAPATSRASRLPTILLAATMFCTGACGLVAEYLLSTVSSYILGNSVEQWSITIALMMAMMGIAGMVQRSISDRYLIERFILLEVVLALLCGFAPIAIYAAFGVMQTHFALVQYFFVSAIGFLIGLEIPLAMRINQAYAKNLKSNLAAIFSLDYVGSFVGAVIWTYCLIRWLPLSEIGFVIAGLNFSVATLTFLYFIRLNAVRYKAVPLACIVLAACALYAGFAKNREWSDLLEQRLYDDKIVSATTTRYQRVVVTYSQRLDDYRLYINGNLQFSSLDEEIYHEQLVHPAMTIAPSRNRILILGGGDGLALREVLKYEDVQEVTLVDLDPEMIRIAQNDPYLRRMNQDSFRDARVNTLATAAVTSTGRVRTVRQETDVNGPKGKPLTMPIGRVNVYNVDADRFLRESTVRWDVIIVDLPDPNSVELVKLYSREFYRKLRRSLTDRGVVVVQSTSPYHAKEAYLCILRTISAAGFATVPYHDNVPSFGDWGWVLATRTEASSLIAAKRMPPIPVPTTYLRPEVFDRATVFGTGWLTSVHTDVNTLMQPVLLDRYLRESWKVE